MYVKQNKTQDIQLMLNIKNTKTTLSQLSPELDEYLAGPVLIACHHHLTNFPSEFFSGQNTFSHGDDLQSDIT